MLTLFMKWKTRLTTRRPSSAWRALGVAAITLPVASLPALAVLPDSGMWTVGDEQNGKPGRGIQIDRQGGKTLIVTYFGYRPDGSSLFLQASGTLQDGKTFTGDLVEYKNGRALGGRAQDGEAASVAGPLSITFDTATSGTILLPGEAAQSVQRFQFEDLKHRLRFSFAASSITHFVDEWARTKHLRLSISGDGLAMTETPDAGSSGASTCNYIGNLVQAGAGFRSQGTVSCSGPTTPTTTSSYRITDLKVDEFGMLSARMYRPMGTSPATESLSSIVGVCRNPIVMLGTPRCGPQYLGLDYEDWKE
jgi:hypothetical protein